MKLSKLSITFALVVSVHVALLGVILLQPGCKNNNNAPVIVSAEQTAAPTGVMQPPSSAEPPPAAVEPEFQPPTRPTWTETAEAKPLENVGDSAPEVAAVSTYTVQRGDSLSRIAKKHGVTVAALAAANNLDTKALLRLGQSLVVPAPSKRAAAAPAPAAALDIPAGESATYVVAKGDSLSKIAAKHGTSVRALQSANKLSSTTIRVGQKLRVPKAGAVAAPAAETKAVAASGNTHKIVAGDTLGGIAKKYGVKLSALKAANPKVDAARLRIGQTIAIPDGAAPAPAAAAPAPVAPAPAAPSEADVPAPVAPVAPVAPAAPVTEAIPEAPVVPAADAAAVPEAPVVPAATLNE